MSRLEPLAPRAPAPSVPAAPPREDERAEIDVLAVLRTLWNGRWWIALLCTLFLGLGVFWLVRLAVPEYVATSVVALEDREQQILDVESVISGLSGDDASVNTEIEVIRSRGLLGKVVDELDLVAVFAAMREEAGPSALERTRTWLAETTGQAWLAPQEEVLTAEEAHREAVDDLLDLISVTNVRDSLVYRISARTTDRDLSVLIANTLARLYILEQIEVKFEATAQATEWLTDRVAELRTELRVAQNRLRDFTAENELVTEEEIGILNRRIADLRERLAEARIDAVAGPAGDTDNAELAAAAAAGDWDVILEATGDATIRRLLTQPESPARDGALAARTAQLAPGAGIRGDRASAQADALAETLAELEARQARQTEDLIRQQAVEREVQQATVLFEYFQSRLRETAVQQNIQQADARLLSQAVPPEERASPRTLSTLAACLVLGLILGSALVLGREASRTGIRSAEDLEALTGITVLGQIPRARTRGRRKMLKYLADRPTSRLAEAYRNLRTSLMLSNIDRPPEVVLSTSSVPGEGKTSQALALAQNFAGLEKSVLIVECDLRRRTFAAETGLSDEFGLVSVLTGTATLDEVVQRMPDLLPGVDVLVGDAADGANPVDIFSSKAFETFVEQARARYDVVILDAPPVLAVPDARVIGRLVDATIYTVRWDDTPRAALREGLRLLSTVGVRVNGLILSQIDLKKQRRYGTDDGSRYSDGYYAN